MKNFSLKIKMLMLCVFLSLITLTVGVASYQTLQNVSKNYDHIQDVSTPKMKTAYEMMLNYRQVRITLRTLGLPGLNATQAEEAIKDAKDSIEKYEEENAAYLKLGFIPGQKELYDEVDGRWKEFKEVGATVLNLYKSGTPDDLLKMQHIFLKDCPEKAKAYRAAITKLIAFHQEVAAKSNGMAKSDASSGVKLILILVLLGSAIGLILGYLMAAKVSNSVSTVANDLSQGAEQVSQAANQIAESSQGLSQSTTEQASSLEETVATMEELTSMVKLNTENAKQAALLASSTRDIAVKGENEINTLIQSINSIAADSKKIEEITNVIDDIAFQTNLLALNAAVEAARAGEQGKGFAVVAEAVRTLAQRSSLAAKDIADLIKNSVQKIEMGSIQATQGGKVLSEIVGSVKKVADLNSEISNASSEQSNGIGEINKAMNQLDQVTQTNASASEESAAAAEELSAQSINLRSSVESLEKIVLGNKKVGTKEIIPSGSRGLRLAHSEPKASSTKVIPLNKEIETDSSRKIGTAEGF